MVRGHAELVEPYPLPCLYAEYVFFAGPYERRVQKPFSLSVPSI